MNAQILPSCKSFVHAGRAGGLKTLMEKFSTFFSLKLSHFLFAAFEQLSLQSKDISAQEAFKAASLTNSYYHQQRNDENFNKSYLSVLQESERIKHVKEPKLSKLRKVPKHIDGGAQSHVYQTPKEHYSQIFF